MLSNTKEPQKGNWRYLLVAFLLALGLWYTLNAREQIERVVEVRLDYKGLPTGRVGKGQQSAFFRKTDMFNAACAGNLEAETAQNKGAACLHTVAAHDAATGDRGRRIEIGSARFRQSARG